MQEELRNYLQAEKDFYASQASFRARFKEWCQDTTVPLEDRWNAFCDSKLGDEERDVYPLEEWVSANSTTEICAEYDRRTVVDSEDLIGTCMVPKDKEDEYKEYVLEKYVRSVKVDW